MNKRAITIALSMLTLVAGCSGFVSSITAIRHREKADRAWKGSRRAYVEKGVPEPVIKDFGAGWKQGYYNVSQGGAGQIPVVAPPKYWGFKNENQGGFNAMSAWFDGFNAGAQAAREQGAGSWSRLPTSAPYTVDYGPDRPSSAPSADRLLGLEPGETLVEPLPASEELPAQNPALVVPENREPR